MTNQVQIEMAQQAMGEAPGGPTRTKLAEMGFPVATIGDLYRIMQAAFDRMSPAERAADERRVNAELGKIGS